MWRRWLSVRGKQPPVEPKPAAADAKTHGAKKQTKSVNSMRHFQAFASMEDYVNVTMIKYKGDQPVVPEAEKNPLPNASRRANDS